jgi:diketogulonate reductase-like aldo/keto reductase
LINIRPTFRREDFSYDILNYRIPGFQSKLVVLVIIHGVDPVTPLEETMKDPEDVVRAGKVCYLGVSNHPAWIDTRISGLDG